MLVSLADMKAYLGLSTTTPEDDAFLEFWLNTVSAAIEDYCQRKFNAVNYTQHWYSDEEGLTNELRTLHFPLISIASIVANGTPVTDGYRADKDMSVIVRERAYWFYGCDEVVIQYRAGYETIPYPIQYAVKSIVQEKWNRRSNGIDMNFGNDVQRISIPGALSIDFDYTLEANNKDTAFGNILGNYINVIDPYRSERSVIGRTGRIYVE